MRRILLALSPLEVAAVRGVHAMAALRGRASLVSGAIVGAYALLTWAIEAGGEVEAMSPTERRALATRLQD